MSTQTPVDPAVYWRALADRRKIALQEANRGCNRLKRHVDRLKREKAELERLLGQASKNYLLLKEAFDTYVIEHTPMWVAGPNGPLIMDTDESRLP